MLSNKKTLHESKRKGCSREESKWSINRWWLFNRFCHSARGGGSFGVRRLAMNRFIDFLAMDGNFLRCDNPQTNLVATNFHDGDGDVIVNDNTFVFFPGQY